MLKHLPIKQIVLLGGDALLVVVSFYVCYAVRTGEFVDVLSKYTGATTLSLFVSIIVFYTADIYNIEGKLYSINNIIKFAITIIIANCLIAVAFYFFHPWRYSRAVFLLNFFFIFSLLFSWRLVFEVVSKYGEKPSRVLIVGAGVAGRALYNILDGSNNFKIIGYLDDDGGKRGMTIGTSTVIGDTSLLPSVIKDKDVEEVIVAIARGRSPELFKRIIYTKFNGVEVHDMLCVYEKISGKIPILHLRDSWLGYADFNGIRKNIYNTRIKEPLDKLIAAIGIVASLPVMLVAMIAIKIGSGGPVFLKQKRIGEGAKVFKALKFRTMENGRENERTLAGSENDPRITRVGKILRFFRIDEIPQLWNVIRGEMSIIGPRSLIEEEVNEFSKKVPYFYLRHSIRPGITGWAQVNYGHGTKVEDGMEKFQYDLYYIKNLSPILDLQILLRTIKVMLYGKGAR